jgi:hypothetical protein
VKVVSNIQYTRRVWYRQLIHAFIEL